MNLVNPTIYFVIKYLNEKVGVLFLFFFKFRKHCLNLLLYKFHWFNCPTLLVSYYWIWVSPEPSDTSTSSFWHNQRMIYRILISLSNLVNEKIQMKVLPKKIFPLELRKHAYGLEYITRVTAQMCTAWLRKELLGWFSHSAVSCFNVGYTTNSFQITSLCVCRENIKLPLKSLQCRSTKQFS